ncbi:hypothetical protein EV641_105132 [Rhodococcus sp. SMB37]|uniref:hypothetical protein n=1 Tax=Rhodococcus sp. SMB37 TaxID=2512213 RepID=UPI0006D151DA|nr:hypothetical protein [Rhodococcus sp. SMB37]TCN54107.1 hypothetical protein EV641_105132 [Rhodococcus sp. SMB37]
MNLLTSTLDSLWQVVLVGLVLGAGLPTIFALGMRSWSLGHDGTGTVDPGRRTLGRVGGIACFTVVVVAIIAGILLLTADFLSSSVGIQLF